MGLIDWFKNLSNNQPREASVNRDPKTTTIKIVGLATGTVSRDFVAPEFDLTQITNAYNTESYVRQACDKYIELMFKQGWGFVGKNTAAVDYIKLRFAAIAEATQTPTEHFFSSCAEDLVKYSNVIIAKARDQAYIYPKGIKVTGLNGTTPVAGYFPLNVVTMTVKRDKNGTVKGWQQTADGQDKPTKFKTEDVVHIYYKREKGAAFGTPFLLPVMDDIRALRQAEENALRLLYRNLFPFYHYQVGTPEFPAEDSEITEAQTEIESMDLEGGLVTSERHNIKSIASDQIIDAVPYLKYFEDRVFTGLGTPATMMGRGSTANKSTSDNMSTEFIDRVKAFQKIFAVFVNEMIIKELLLEGGIDSLLNPDDAVYFQFQEIDVDAKIKAENHAIFQYEHNAITEDEMRIILGRDPITDRALMFMNLVSIPLVDATAAATAANAEPGTPATNNKNTPTNKPKPKSTTKSSYSQEIQGLYEQLNNTIVFLTRNYTEKKTNNILFSKQVAVAVFSTEKAVSAKLDEHLNPEHKDIANQYYQLAAKRYYDVLVDALQSISTEESLIETINSLSDVMDHYLESIAEIINTQIAITQGGKND